MSTARDRNYGGEGVWEGDRAWGQESGQGHVRAMSTRQGLGRIKGYVRVQDSGW